MSHEQLSSPERLLRASGLPSRALPAEDPVAEFQCEREERNGRIRSQPELGAHEWIAEAGHHPGGVATIIERV